MIHLFLIILCGTLTAIADLVAILIGSALCFSPHKGSDYSLVKKAFIIGAGLSLALSTFAGLFGLVGSIVGSAVVYLRLLRNQR